MKIHIDPGHGDIDPSNGAYDPGAVGPRGVCETDINLAVGLELGKILNDNGYEVVYSRTKNREIDIWPIIDDIFYDSGSDMLISIHCNAAVDRSATGIETYYNAYSPAGKKLAGIIQNDLMDAFPEHIDRGLGDKSLRITGISSELPIVLLELEFLSNPLQEQFLANKDNQKKISLTIANSINKYYGIVSTSDTISDTERNKVKSIIKKVSEEHKLPYIDILAQCIIESNLDPNAISKSRALGVCQMKLATAQYIAKRHKLHIPQNDKELLGIDNVEYCVTLMCYMLNDLLAKVKDNPIYAARMLYYSGESSFELGVLLPYAVEYSNKVVKKINDIKQYI